LENVTGAMNRYPCSGSVSMNLGTSAVSFNACRSRIMLYSASAQSPQALASAKAHRAESQAIDTKNQTTFITAW
jgi:hypothetical protein